MTPRNPCKIILILTLWLGLAALATAQSGAIAAPSSRSLAPTYAVPSATPAPVQTYTPPSAVPYSSPAPMANPAPTYATIDTTNDTDDADTEEPGIYWIWGTKWPGLGLGAKIGTTGLGADVTFGILPRLNLRGGGNFGSFSFKMKFEDIKYDLDVDMVTFPLMLDFHPFANNFRITAGVYFNSSFEADLKATPSKVVQIGHHSYPAEVIGNLKGKAEADSSISPFLGIGYGNAVGRNQKWTLFMEAGVMFHSYSVDLTSDGAGMDALLDLFREDIERERKNIEDDLNDWKIYPVVTLGATYHF